MTDLAKDITKKSKSSFYYTFSLLPEEKRNAMNTVYAFCRQTDDIVDEGNEPEELKYNKLKNWRIELERAVYDSSNYALLNTLVKTIKKFNIPYDPFFELIKGMEMDLEKKSYFSFEDLSLYCYRVASTVGLMCIEIFGYKHSSTKDFAINLGIALQLTNILRDINKDAEKGRIYLPQEDLTKFNYSPDDLHNKIYNNNFQELMKYQVQRAESYFVKATDSLNIDDKYNMFAARAMQHIYAKLLDKIKKANYNVLEERIRVSNLEKVFISLGVWTKYNIVY